MTTLDQFSLTDKVAVVTGGTGQYGEHFSRALAQAGAHVVITSRDLDRAEGAAASLRGDGLRATGMHLDQADPEGAEQFIGALIDRVGRLDVLVNNAVLRAGAGLEDTTAADWSATSEVNSRGLFLLTQAAAAVMHDHAGGSIINVGSIYGVVAPDFSVYGDTGMTTPIFYSYDKAGMVGLTRYLAAWLGPRGIRVNCISPGGFLADQPAAFKQRYEARVPLGRLAGRDDVTGALVFLASDAAGYITGVNLPVDGGWTAL